MTIATSTPCSRTSRISAAIASTVGRSMPYSRSPISASPESLSRIRWKAGSATEREALELEHLGAFLRQSLADRLRLVVDPRLVEEDAAALREEALVHHPVDDLLARLLGLRLHLVRARVDLALGGHDILGHVLAGDPARLRPCDVHGEPAAEIGRAAPDVDERADLVRGGVDVGGDRRAVHGDEAGRTCDRDVLAELRDELDA